MRERLLAVAAARFQRSVEVSSSFFDANADKIAPACSAMAQRFDAGGRLLVFGSGAEATDALHISVEFVHPVLVGKKALPALALTNNFAAELAVLGRPADIAIGLSYADIGPSVVRSLERARAMNMLTIALTAAPLQHDFDFNFAVPCGDALIVQETHETLYHILWELVHVFLGSSRASDCMPDENGHCALCADEGIPGQVVSIDVASNTASTVVDGMEQTVALDFLPNAAAGDTVLIHMGFAIARLEAS